MNILRIKFNIDSSIHCEKGKDRIYINQINLLKLLPHIKPHMHPYFYYKLHLTNFY